jgi:hypothetical protein
METASSSSMVGGDSVVFSADRVSFSTESPPAWISMVAESLSQFSGPQEFQVFVAWRSTPEPRPLAAPKERLAGRSISASPSRRRSATMLSPSSSNQPTKVADARPLVDVIQVEPDLTGGCRGPPEDSGTIGSGSCVVCLLQSLERFPAGPCRPEPFPPNSRSAGGRRVGVGHRDVPVAEGTTPVSSAVQDPTGTRRPRLRARRGVLMNSVVCGAITASCGKDGHGQVARPGSGGRGGSANHARPAQGVHPRRNLSSVSGSTFQPLAPGRLGSVRSLSARNDPTATFLLSNSSSSTSPGSTGRGAGSTRQ